MKLPDKKYEPKHNDELREYAMGWNTIKENAEYLCKEFGDEHAKERLSQNKELLQKIEKTPFFKGQYDCILEIEKLNEEPEHRLDNLFQDSLDALDKLNIRGE